jgi:hypothetical protein
LPTHHETREERITREIHTHDTFHRALPVIETEILPPKHYVPSPDGKGLTEIPEHMVPGRTETESPSRNWEIVETGIRKSDSGSTFRRKTPSQQSSTHAQSLTEVSHQGPHAGINAEDGADGPVVGFVRGATKVNRSRANSRTSTHTRGTSRTLTHSPKTSKKKNILEPILSSKKEYMTKEGYPKTEYVWRHPPVFETATGQTQHVYIGTGLGDISAPTTAPISGETYYSDEDDVHAAEFGAMRPRAKGEEELLFRDGGYGSQGMLPGLADKTPLAGLGGAPAFNAGDFEVIRFGRVLGEDNGAIIGKARVVSNAEGEATKALRKRRKRRSSAPSTTSAAKTNGNHISEVERGMHGLNVRE